MSPEFKSKFGRWRERGMFSPWVSPYLELERPCQIWKGNTTKGGYGTVSINGSSTTVSRYIFEQVYGPLDDDKVVRHKCDRPLCCEPSHMEPGTQLQNIHDKVRTGNYSPTEFPCGHDRYEHSYKRSNGKTVCRECMRIRDKRRTRK